MKKKKREVTAREQTTKQMNKADLIKRIAGQMIQHQLKPHLGKKDLHKSFQARINKKKIPIHKEKKKEDNRRMYSTDEQQSMQRETERDLFGS